MSFAFVLTAPCYTTEASSTTLCRQDVAIIVRLADSVVDICYVDVSCIFLTCVIQHESYDYKYTKANIMTSNGFYYLTDSLTQFDL